MEFEEYLEYIEKKLYEKNINTETQDYIIKYVYMNQKLFGKHLNIDKLVSRILNNLNHNITSFDINNTPLNELKRIITTRGRWDPYQNKITTNPINKLKGMLFKREKQKHNSSIMHEIDHCATTEYLQISKPEYEQYIQSYIKRNHIKNPQDISNIRNSLNQMYNEHEGILEISGIQDFRQLLQNGIDLKKLNEGITAYKQELYDKFLGNKPNTAYTAEKEVARFIGKVIGRDNLINMHFNNDYEGIKTSFNERTGKDLNKLVELLDQKSILNRFLPHKLNTKIFTKKFEKFEKNCEIKPERKNADFVPKFNIDYTKVGKFLEESKTHEQIKDNEKEL